MAAAVPTGLNLALMARMAEISEIDVLITDDSADPEELDRLRALGVEIVLA